MIIQRIKTAVRQIYDRFVRLNGSPRQTALGFALGLFIGMSPFWGMHILLCVGLAWVFGWSKIAAMIGVNITNVVTAPLIYPINYWVGVKLAGISGSVNWSTASDYEQILKLMRQSPLILIDLSIGGLILGTPLAVAGYFISLKAICLYRNRAVSDAADQCPR